VRIQVLAYVTAAWAVVMALAPVLQIRKMLLAGSSSSVSVAYFSLLCVGFALWVSYGLSNHNLIVATPNGVALATGLLTIAVARRLRGFRDEGGGRDLERGTPLQ
jgi:MtN3 and saliva related transmembrane protein